MICIVLETMCVLVGAIGLAAGLLWLGLWLMERILRALRIYGFMIQWGIENRRRIWTLRRNQ